MGGRYRVPSRQQVKNLSDEDLRQLVSMAISESQLRRTADGYVAQLAAMQAGDSQIIPGLNIHKLGTTKRHARYRLREPTAQWSGRTTSKGLRVTRTA